MKRWSAIVLLSLAVGAAVIAATWSDAGSVSRSEIRDVLQSQSVVDTPVIASSSRMRGDSVRLLLFAGFRIERLVVRGMKDWTINGSARNGGDSSVIVLETDGLRIDDSRVTGNVLIHPDDGELELTAAERHRLIPGTIDVEVDSGRLRVIARVAIEDYLAAALASEATATDPLEYLVALSVMQRNYLRSHSDRHGDDAEVCDNTHCQVAFLRPATPRGRGAVALASELQLRSGEALPSYYSGCCGGRTITPGEIWNHAEPGYSSVQCNYCNGSRWYRWQRSVRAEPGVQKLLETAPATPFTDDDYKIRVGREIGFNVVLSNRVERITRRGDHYIIEGRGFGHRIGLCQEGARTLARHGRKAADILRFYFPTAQITAIGTDNG